jgi:hypothetical protein
MLFKYCSFRRAFEILKSQRIRLTQSGDFNDPFELHPEFQLMSQEDIAALPPALDEQGNVIPGMRQLTPAAMNQMIEAAIPQINHLSYINNKNPQDSFVIDNNEVGRRYYNDNYGILSLTETPDNLLMWAHYGDSHKGVVLGFDVSHPFFQGAEIVSGLSRLSKVEYNQKRPVLSLITRDQPKVFLRKSTEWSYEKEWRLIRPLSEAVEHKLRENLAPICIFDLPHDVIKVVITGSQMITREHQEICNYVRENIKITNIKIHHTILSRELYKVEIHPALTEENQSTRMQLRIMSAKPNDV